MAVDKPARRPGRKAIGAVGRAQDHHPRLLVVCNSNVFVGVGGCRGVCNVCRMQRLPSAASIRACPRPGFPAGETSVTPSPPDRSPFMKHNIHRWVREPPDLWDRATTQHLLPPPSRCASLSAPPPPASSPNHTPLPPCAGVPRLKACSHQCVASVSQVFHAPLGHLESWFEVFWV